MDISSSKLLLFVCLAVALISGSTAGRIRKTRSLVYLGRMVHTLTGRCPFEYNYYGNWCGLGGGPDEPVDGVDRCCQQHDQCYGHYQEECGHGADVMYNVKIKKKEINCNDYMGWYGPCGERICECDRKFANCLSKVEYTAANRKYPMTHEETMYCGYYER